MANDVNKMLEALAKATKWEYHPEADAVGLAAGTAAQDAVVAADDSGPDQVSVFTAGPAAVAFLEAYLAVRPDQSLLMDQTMVLA